MASTMQHFVLRGQGPLCSRPRSGCNRLLLQARDPGGSRVGVSPGKGGVCWMGARAACVCLGGGGENLVGVCMCAGGVWYVCVCMCWICVWGESAVCVHAACVCMC